ncbi:unnamed protein product [Cuscuta campestris]|uniref:Uncharacterized protein n=1 Tax=Cuscuta campestris TaxID=132261 RepID=A0A484LQH2_9ASTE|nr:unnamed protein product [Cuscuta campestris]
MTWIILLRKLKAIDQVKPWLWFTTFQDLVQSRFRSGFWFLFLNSQHGVKTYVKKALIGIGISMSSYCNTKDLMWMTLVDIVDVMDLRVVQMTSWSLCSYGCCSFQII